METPTTTCRKSSAGSFGATICHLWKRSVAPCSKDLETSKTVTVEGTRTSLIFHAVMTPKLDPPPPLMAQKRSSPISVLFSIFPFTSIIWASMTLSEAKPYFLKIVPNPPPLKCPPTPTVEQLPAGNPWTLLLCAIA
ncbi:hypothetical protein V8G54_001711 [Vigna mungo]|uniref:Uncharacterized protein n=1 Tax=Vigna mungo TaxID=3915 RepID=A0AAQ3P9X8_VIGMU